MRYIKLFESFFIDEMRDNIEGILVDLIDKGLSVTVGNITLVNIDKGIFVVISDDTETNFKFSDIVDEVNTVIDYVKSELGDSVSISLIYYFDDEYVTKSITEWDNSIETDILKIVFVI